VLFRRFKDPAILSPQFEPLYDRLRFMDDLAFESTDLESLRARALELIAFVGALKMGDFYSNQLRELLAPVSHARMITLDMPQSKLDQWRREEHIEYLEKLTCGHDDSLRLCAELLRYQDWLPAQGV